MRITKIKNLFDNLPSKAMAGFIVGIVLVISITVGLAFTEPDSGPLVDEPANTMDMGNWTAYGRRGTATTTLTKTTCESAAKWYWFEDGNGDGDYTDEEDGICVQASSTNSGILTWNGNDCDDEQDNSYIAAYECEGAFPNGTIKAGSYSGRYTDVTCTDDTTWNDGDCALCQADCYDGKKDLPDQNGYTAGDEDITTGNHGPISSEVLKNWTGTRLPTSLDFFGFCGFKNGSNPANDYETDCSNATTTGNYGHMIGRTDECLDLSDTSYEWLSERHYYFSARRAGSNACSCFGYGHVGYSYRFRAVFRP